MDGEAGIRIMNGYRGHALFLASPTNDMDIPCTPLSLSIQFNAAPLPVVVAIPVPRTRGELLASLPLLSPRLPPLGPLLATPPYPPHETQ